VRVADVPARRLYGVILAISITLWNQMHNTRAVLPVGSQQEASSRICTHSSGLRIRSNCRIRTSRGIEQVCQGGGKGGKRIKLGREQRVWNNGTVENTGNERGMDCEELAEKDGKELDDVDGDEDNDLECNSRDDGMSEPNDGNDSDIATGNSSDDDGNSDSSDIGDDSDSDADVDEAALAEREGISDYDEGIQVVGEGDSEDFLPDGADVESDVGFDEGDERLIEGTGSIKEAEGGVKFKSINQHPLINRSEESIHGLTPEGTPDSHSQDIPHSPQDDLKTIQAVRNSWAELSRRYEAEAEYQQKIRDQMGTRAPTASGLWRGIRLPLGVTENDLDSLVSMATWMVSQENITVFTQRPHGKIMGISRYPSDRLDDILHPEDPIKHTYGEVWTVVGPHTEKNDNSRSSNPDGMLQDKADSIIRDGYYDEADAGGPTHIAIDTTANPSTKGNIYFTDMERGLVRVVTPSGRVRTIGGNRNDNRRAHMLQRVNYLDGYRSSAEFRYPKALTVAPNGDVFVADSGHHVIRRITPKMEVTTFAGSGMAGERDGARSMASFCHPSGVAYHPDGFLVVADTGNWRLRGVLLPASMRHAPKRPRKLRPSKDTLLEDGFVWTLTGFACRKRRLIPRKTMAGQGASTNCRGYRDGKGYFAKFLSPQQVCVGKDDSIYVTDRPIAHQTEYPLAHAIRKVTLNATTRSPWARDVTVSSIWGGDCLGRNDARGLDARFHDPAGLAADGEGNIYVCDSANHRIRKCMPDGVVLNIAGQKRGEVDGLTNTARFDTPTGIALDDDGDLYITEKAASTRSGRIRMLHLHNHTAPATNHNCTAHQTHLIPLNATEEVARISQMERERARVYINNTTPRELSTFLINDFYATRPYLRPPLHISSRQTRLDFIHLAFAFNLCRFSLVRLPFDPAIRNSYDCGIAREEFRGGEEGARLIAGFDVKELPVRYPVEALELARQYLHRG